LLSGFYQPFSGFARIAAAKTFVPSEEGLDGVRALPHRTSSLRNLAKELPGDLPFQPHIPRLSASHLPKGTGADADRFSFHPFALLGERMQEKAMRVNLPA
jgi:hypothetical protein